jgi:pilus assembly protein CpaD
MFNGGQARRRSAGTGGGSRGATARVALAAAVTAAGLLVLAGCHSGGANEHSERHQLSAERRTFQADVPVPTVSADGREGVISLPRGFLDDYHRRARTPMRVTPPRPLSVQDEAATGMLVRWLEDHGVDTVMAPAPVGRPGPAPGTAGLSFEAYVVQVPECGDWSGNTGWNPGNTLHSNFGCSYNRNIGLMLSDPGDIVTGRAPGPADTPRQTLVIETYRLGEPTTTRESESEEGGLTEIGE